MGLRVYDLAERADLAETDLLLTCRSGEAIDQHVTLREALAFPKIIAILHGTVSETMTLVANSANTLNYRVFEVEVDPLSLWDGVTGRLTVPVAGIYRLSCAACFNAQAANEDYLLYAWVNAVPTAALGRLQAADTGHHIIGNSVLLNLNADDYVQVRLYISTSAAGVTVADIWRSHLSIEFVCDPIA